MTAVLGVLGGWVILANYMTAFRWIAHHKTGSLVPLLGGVLFAAAMIACPVAGVTRWAWLPLLVDLGCATMLVSGLYHVIFRR